jgi:hypothetical protein
MSYVKWELKHIPFDGGWNPADETTLMTFMDPLVSTSLGDNKDSFNFKVRNVFGNADNQFNANDRITISRVRNTDTVNSTDVLMVGTVKDVPNQVDAKQDFLRVEGYNYSEIIMQTIVFLDSNGDDIPTVLSRAITEANKVGNYELAWDSSFNPTLKTDGTSFPSITKRYFNVPLFKIFEELSTKDITDDTRYYFYVTKENKVRWFAKTDNTRTNQYTFDYTTDAINAFKSGKDVKDVRNFIIAKGGISPSGSAIQIKEVDYASAVKHGYKYYFLVNENIQAGNLIEDDMLKSWGEADYKKYRYPDFTGGSFTTSWKYQGESTVVVEGVTMTPNSTVTVADNDEYNAVIIEQSKAILKKKSREILDITSKGRYKVDLTFEAGEKSWGLGDKITCTIPKDFSGTKTLRVFEVQYSTNEDVFSLEEDIGEGTL